MQRSFGDFVKAFMKALKNLRSVNLESLDSLEDIIMLSCSNLFELLLDFPGIIKPVFYD